MLDMLILLKITVLVFLIFDGVMLFTRGDVVDQKRWSLLTFYITLTIIINEIEKRYSD